jgi:hypothetical protein
MKEFKVGQKVNVIGIGGCHINYEAFFSQNNLLKFELKYREGALIELGIHTVVATGWYDGKENDTNYGKMYLLEDKNGQMFIMSNKDGKYLEPATLSTGDMMNLLAQNPGQIYKSDTHTAYMDGSLFRLKYHGGASETSGNIRLIDASIFKADTWTLVPEPPKPISIEEAAKASKDGKTIICKFPNFNNQLDEWTTECRPSEAYLTFHMIHTGKWYIKEE